MVSVDTSSPAFYAFVGLFGALVGAITLKGRTLRLFIVVVVVACCVSLLWNNLPSEEDPDDVSLSVAHSPNAAWESPVFKDESIETVVLEKQPSTVNISQLPQPIRDAIDQWKTTSEYKIFFDCARLPRAGPLRDKYAVFTGMLMNNQDEIPRMAELIEAMGSCFADYEVVLAENDSKDNTKNMLRAWSEALNPGRIVLDMRDYNRTKRPSINWMATLRNKVLELAFHTAYSTQRKHRWLADVLINIDMDLAAVDMEGFVEAAVGVVDDVAPMVGAACNGWHATYRYKDTFAFRGCMVEWDARVGNMHDLHVAKKNRRSVHNFQRVFTNDLPPFPVDSAFGGIAIYRASAVFGRELTTWNGNLSALAFRKYKVAKSPKRNVFTNYSQAIEVGYETEYPCQYGTGGFPGEMECEHIPFHACVNGRARRHGLRSLHVVPQWGVWYGPGMPGPPSRWPKWATRKRDYFEAKVPNATKDQDWHWIGPQPVTCQCDLLLPSLCPPPFRNLSNIVAAVPPTRKKMQAKIPPWVRQAMKLVKPPKLWPPNPAVPVSFGTENQSKSLLPGQQTFQVKTLLFGSPAGVNPG